MSCILLGGRKVPRRLLETVGLWGWRFYFVLVFGGNALGSFKSECF